MEVKIDEARREFNAIIEYVVKAALGREIHEVEEGIYRRLLGLGRILLELFLMATGTGNVGKSLSDEDGVVFRYLRDAPWKYLSIFGEIVILRAYYGREGSQGRFPLDAILNLPERSYSYVLQKWMCREGIEATFEKAAKWVRDYLGLNVHHRAVQRVNLDCAQPAEEFAESLVPPPVEEEGPILIHSADCKGIRMCIKDRNPDLPRSEDKPGEKRMACISRNYSTDPHFCNPEVIVDSLIKARKAKAMKDKDPKRPKPCHRRTIVSLLKKKSEIFEQSERASTTRIHSGTQEKAVLMDGEKALWKLSATHFAGWTEIIDFYHVMEKIWIAASLHHPKGGQEAEDYVRERALLLLEGDVNLVIEDFQWALEDGTLSEADAVTLKSKVVGYFLNNSNRMAYDQYLAKGLPIATGIIESTCNSLVKVRMEGPGMFWSPDGAEAMLRLRAIYIDDLWDDFWTFRAKREKKRLYAHYLHIADNWIQNQEEKFAA